MVRIFATFFIGFGFLVLCTKYFLFLLNAWSTHEKFIRMIPHNLMDKWILRQSKLIGLGFSTLHFINSLSKNYTPFSYLELTIKTSWHHECLRAWSK